MSFGVVAALLLGLALLRARPALADTVVVTVLPTSATTLTIGSAVVVSIRNANTTPSSIKLTDNYFLLYPDGTRFALTPLATTSTVPANGYSSMSQAVTSSAFTTETGSFTLEVDATDATGSVLGVGTAQFTILPLPPELAFPRFTDLAQSAGLAAIHHSDSSDCINMMGTGAGWADFNGDGWPDLFVSDFKGASHLYQNNGNLTFTDVTATAFPGSLMNGSLQLAHASGVTWADYDNDGHPDLLVMAAGHPFLFHNNGGGTFTDVTTSAGLAGLTYRGEGAAWGDYDRDGYLDLYVVYYNQNCYGNPIRSSLLAPDHLFRNNGNGTFSDTTSLLGGTTNPAVTGFGFAAAWFDSDGDNWPDLYAVNDFGSTIHGNVFWRNNGFTLTDASSTSHLNFKISSMGVAVGDYDRDGNFDVAVSNQNANVLARGKGGGVFSNVAQALGAQRAVDGVGGTANKSSTWGLGFVDLNNDGYQDLFIGGGDMKSIGRNAVLVNNLNHHLTGVPNDGTFLDLTYGAGMIDSTARTVAFADVDGDGWVDAFVSNYFDAPPQLYHNDGALNGSTSHWLEVRLVGAGASPLGSLPHGSNLDGVGAKLTLTAASDVQHAEILSGSSLGAGDQLAAHFGLAQHTQADTLTIDWPSGLTQTFTNLPVDERLVITEGSSMIGTDPTHA